MNPLLITTKNIKHEAECCCCFSRENLFSLLEPYNFEENVEIYSTMIAECFRIQFTSYVGESDKFLYLICKNCVFRLKDAILLRSQIQLAYDRFQAEYCVKDDPDVILSECSDVIETKEHIPKYDNMECNTNVDPGTSSSSVLKLKPLKIVSQKNDNVTMENTSIVSANGGSVAKSEPSEIFYCNDLHLNINKYTCKYCNRLFKKKEHLSKHEKIHLNIKNFICNYCEKGFRQKEHLKEHIMLHMNIKNVKCDRCDKYFVSERAVLSHKRKYHSVRLSCNICNKTLGSKNSFNKHVLLHSATNEKCEICKKNFATSSLLNAHRLRCNTNKNTCKYCNKQFQFKSKLLRHENTHLKKIGLVAFTCDYCKKGFSTKDYLKDHILLHTKSIKNIKCDLCDEVFVSKTLCRKHKRNYHSIRPSCDVCGNTFSSNTALKYHALSHSGVKSEKCEICEKTFTRKDLLVKHVKLHFNGDANKNKKCKYCHKMFSTNYKLLRHENVHLKNVKV